MNPFNCSLLACVLVLASFNAGAGTPVSPPSESDGPTEQGKPAARPGSDDDRVVCKTEKKLGSNRAERVCRTKRQIREDREAALTRSDEYGRCAGNQSVCGGKQIN